MQDIKIFCFYRQNLWKQYSWHLLMQHLQHIRFHHTQFLKHQKYFLNTYHSHKYMCYDSNYNFFAYTITYTLTSAVSLFHFWFELQVVLLNLHLQPHEICFTIVLASVLFVIILDTLTLMSFFHSEHKFF